MGSRCQEWTEDGGWQAPRTGKLDDRWGEGHVEGQTDGWKGHCGAADQGYTPPRVGWPFPAPIRAARILLSRS